MSQVIPQLSANTREYVGSNAFENDQLDRKKLAQQLTTYLDRLKDGAVLAIDAPWGAGKTWFGKNWSHSLRDAQHKVIYIDAFEQDYIEDPFMLLTSEILEVIKDDSSPMVKSLKDSSIKIAKALLPSATKALVNLGGKVLLGTNDIHGEIKEALTEVTSATADSTSKWIEEKLEAYSDDKQTMSEFKTRLTTYAQALDKPIVIFIDELDRCKPTFAVNLVERIKHFFDVPNIVFVLLLNREQLEKAIKGVYGIETDASTYLDKFINFFFALPNANQKDKFSQKNLESFIKLTMNKYKFEFSDDNNTFIEYMRIWAMFFKLSLRDIEKCVALYAFAYPANDIALLTYIIVLKVKNPSLFKRLVTGEIKAHSEAQENINSFLIEAKNGSETQYLENIFLLYIEWHKAHTNRFTGDGESLKSLRLDNGWHMEKKDYFKYLAAKIDIDIKR